MVDFEINNQTKFRIPKKKIEHLFCLLNKELKLKNKNIVSLAFVSPKNIQKLNKTYRKKDFATDVLSFEQTKTKENGGLLGEIIVCSAVAQKQAKEFAHSFEKEILKLVLHGFLHLLGYDHVKLNEAKKMESLEAKLLQKFYDKSKKIDK